MTLKYAYFNCFYSKRLLNERRALDGVGITGKDSTVAS